MEFRDIRRKDRVLENGQARELLNDGEYGFLALCSPEGYGYSIPLNYAVDGEKIYFHCAPEGHKLEAIRGNDKASFCVVGKTQVIPRQFSTAYESVHAFGRVGIVTDDEERRQALRLIAAKYSPEYGELAEKYIAGSFGRTVVLRFDIEHLSGKYKRIEHPERFL